MTCHTEFHERSAHLHEWSIRLGDGAAAPWSWRNAQQRFSETGM